MLNICVTILPKIQIQWNLSNPTDQGTREMFQIAQDVRTCLIWHIKEPGKCFRLYRMSEPVLSDTSRNQGNVSDCTGCQNMSNLTHQGTREMFQIVQDVRTCLIWHIKEPGNVSDCTGCRKAQVSDCTSSTAIIIKRNIDHRKKV